MTVRKGLAAAMAVAALSAGALTAPASAAVRTDAAASRSDHRATERAIRAVVDAGVPGVTAQARDGHRTWRSAVGTGDLATGAPRGSADHYRVGSISKTFLATVLLQLEAEGRIDLDDTVEQWLPGVVQGHGNDGSRITVRQVLQHTSGIFDVTSDEEWGRQIFTTEFLKNRYRTWTGPQLVGIAMRHAPVFAPGAKWQYSNTNYNLAGMLVERVTGRPYAEEIRRRILAPLGLRGTRSPGTDPSLPAPHSRAYSRLSQDPDAKNTYDVTALNPSLAGAAGDMVSDSADLNRFFSALLSGKLLPRKQLDEMKAGVPIGPDAPGVGYGLALIERKLSCGITVWGHDGGIHGSTTGATVTADGKHALAFNLNGDWAGDTEAVVEAEFCDK